MDLHDLVRALKEMVRDSGGNIPKRDEFLAKFCTRYHIKLVAGGWTNLLKAADLYSPPGSRKNPPFTDQPSLSKPPKILFLDIETAPIEARVWGLWDQNIALNQITKDWFIMSFAAEMDGAMNYLDQRYAKPIEDESMLLVAIHHLLCQSDIVVGHNVARFDIKKLNARFLKHGMNPPTSFRVIDTLKIAKKHFALTSNKLEHIAKLLGVSEKMTNRSFNGMALWNECLAGNMQAWEEMEAYNKQDVVTVKEVYEKLLRWDKSINFSVFTQENECSCGSKSFTPSGVKVTNSGKFERLICELCGKEHIRSVNLMHPETRKELLK